MDELFISNKDPLKIAKYNKNLIFNFINTESLWYYKNNKNYYNALLNKNMINFPDGSFVSQKLNLIQKRGPTFTRDFLLSNYSKSKKHFFISNHNKEKISKITKINEKNIICYNPSFINTDKFSNKEINIILNQLKLQSPDFIWIGIGAPKQEILSNQLFNLYNGVYLNVGAGIDFLMKAKKEAPNLFILLKLEWFYRLFTDFNKNYKKVYRSIIGLKYLKKLYVNKYE